MKADKINNIKLFGSVHTFTIRCTYPISALPDEFNWVRSQPSHRNNKNQLYYYYTLNLNKYAGKELWTQSEFNKYFHEALFDLGLSEEDTVFYRIDYRFDQLEDTYQEQEKLHLALIALLSRTYKMENFYQSLNPITYEGLTVRAQGARYQFENYNKSKEDPCCPARNRFEIRTLKVNDRCDISRLMEEWIIRMRKALKNYDNLQNLCNMELVKLYQSEMKSKKVRTLSEFIRKYQQTIFSNSQLVDLMKQLGKENPKSSAHNCKIKNKIEFVSRKDLETYIDKMSTVVAAYKNDTQEGYQKEPFSNQKKSYKVA